MTMQDLQDERLPRLGTWMNQKPVVWAGGRLQIPRSMVLFRKTHTKVVGNCSVCQTVLWVSSSCRVLASMLEAPTFNKFTSRSNLCLCVLFACCG